jgi:hypothetical protein
MSTELTAANPTISSAEPTVQVTVPNTSGTVTFQLVVTDNLGTKSEPVTVSVEIQAAPVGRLSANPVVVPAGGTITLSGEGSSAVAPGTLTDFSFTVENPASPIT